MKKLSLLIIALVAFGQVFGQSADIQDPFTGSALHTSHLPSYMFSGRTPVQGSNKTNETLINVFYWGSEDTVRNGFGVAPVFYPSNNSYVTIGQINSNITAATPNANTGRSSAGSYINGRVNSVSSAGVLFNAFRDVITNNVSTIPLHYRVDSIILGGFQRKNSDFLTEDTLNIIIAQVDSFASGGSTFMWPSTNKPAQKPVFANKTFANSARFFEFLDVPKGFYIGADINTSNARPFAALVEFRGPSVDTLYLGGSLYPRTDPNPQPGFIYFRTLTNKKGVYRRPFAPNASNGFNKWNITEAPNSTTDTVNSGFWIWSSPFVQAKITLDPTTTSVDQDLIGKNLTSLSAYPNPVLRGTDVNLAFETNVGGNVTMSISNLLGAEVYHQEISKLAAGQSTVEVNTAAFTPGVYVARVRTSFGAVATTKFIVN